MTYRPPTRAPRKYGRRHEKVKAKAKGRKRRSGGSYMSETHVLSSEEVADRALNRLRILGKQRFALPPFSEHFNRWLLDLRDVLSEFESSPNISVDDQFAKERSQILSNVELDLEERRRKEAPREEAIKSLSDTRILLKRIEEEYITKAKEIERRKDDGIKRLSSKVDGLREELNHITRTKTGILERILRKVEEQKETKAIQRLKSAQEELASTIQYFTAEQEKLRNEYERGKRPVIEQMRDHQKEVENQDTDSSLETRRIACEALINAVNALLQRNLQIRNA